MEIEGKKWSVGDAFNNFFYTIPDYQREYVWEEKHVSQLLDDIYEEFQDRKDSEYFIGSIVVYKKDKDAEKKFEVIDGQQRLTTLFACLCAFKKLLKDDKDSIEIIQPKIYAKDYNSEGKSVASYKLILQYENTSELIAKIAEDKPLPDNLQGSAQRITDAYLYLQRYIETNFKEKEEKTKFLSYISRKVNLMQIETPSISDALKIFETINSRGVGLNPMDLLKNLIFRKVNKEQFDKLKDEWKKITDILEKNDEKPLRFLRYFIMANYLVKNSKGEEIVREEEIYEWITANESQCGYENDPFKFVSLIQKNAEAYVKYSQGKDKENNRNVYLDNIKNLSGSFSQHLILLLAGKDLQKDIFNHLAKQVESLIFWYILTKTQTKELERKFSQWAKAIKKLGVLSNEEQKEGLNMFISEKIEPEIRSRETEFKNNFLNFYYHTLQKYRLKYILAKITQYVDLRALGQTNDEVLDVYLKPTIQIEHILPQTPTQELVDDFEKEAGKGVYGACMLQLGNLTLLEKPMNIVAGRNYFDLKKEEYKKSNFRLTKSIATIENVGVNSSINRINTQLKSFTRWTKESIIERQNILYNLAKKVWNIEKL